MKRSSLHDIANIVLYVILFLLIQLAVTFAVAIIAMWIGGTPWSSISQHLQTGSLGLNGKELVAATAISSVLTFVFCRLPLGSCQARLAGHAAVDGADMGGTPCSWHHPAVAMARGAHGDHTAREC